MTRHHTTWVHVRIAKEIVEQMEHAARVRAYRLDRPYTKSDLIRDGINDQLIKMEKEKGHDRKN